MSERPEPPYISLARLSVLDLGLLEQRFGLRLRVQNPNRFALPIRGMRFALVLNERGFAPGVSDRAVTIPAFGEKYVDVQLVTNLARVVEQMRRWDDRKVLDYQLAGLVSLKGGGRPLPFDISGEIAPPQPPAFRQHSAERGSDRDEPVTDRADPGDLAFDRIARP